MELMLDRPNKANMQEDPLWSQVLMRKVYGLGNRAVLQLARSKFRNPPAWCRRIAFSEQESWEPIIRKSFADWPIEIIFAKPADLNLDEFDLVVPLNVNDSLWLAAQADFNARNPIPVPSASVIKLCDDKKAFDEALNTTGFGRHSALREGFGTYPYILRKRHDHSSISVQIINNKADESRFDALCHDPDYFTQRLISGHKEYATHINFTGGKVVSELTVEYTFSTPQSVKFKDPVVYQHYVRCPDLPVLAGMLRALNYQGLCCFNYKVMDGVVVVFELNPRFGGSLCPLFFSFVGALSESPSMMPLRRSRAMPRAYSYGM